MPSTTIAAAAIPAKAVKLIPPRAAEIPLPKLEIQKKMVNYLEKLDILRKRRETANEKSMKILQSIFIEMFGDPTKNGNKYPIKKLQEVCVKITDGSHRTPKILTEGYPFLTVANMEEFDFDYNDCKRISKEEYDNLVKNDCKPLNGDVLFSKDGTVGKVMEIKKLQDQVLLSSIAIIRPNKDLINSTFLSEFMKSDFALNQAINMKSGSAIRRIILKRIKEIKIIIPPLEMQKRFNDLVERVQRIKSYQENSTIEINNLSGALVQKAFNGEL